MEILKYFVPPAGSISYTYSLIHNLLLGAVVTIGWQKSLYSAATVRWDTRLIEQIVSSCFWGRSVVLSVL